PLLRYAGALLPLRGGQSRTGTRWVVDGGCVNPAALSPGAKRGGKVPARRSATGAGEVGGKARPVSHLAPYSATRGPFSHFVGDKAERALGGAAARGSLPGGAPHHPLPTTHHSLLTTYHLPPTTYHLPPTTRQAAGNNTPAAAAFSPSPIRKGITPAVIASGRVMSRSSTRPVTPPR